MDGEDRAIELSTSSLLTVTIAWLPLLIVLIAWRSYRRVRDDRRAYTGLAPTERASIVACLLFVIHEGMIEKGQRARGYVRKPAHVLADLLDLNLHTTDEALRRLIRHGYLGGVLGTTIWSLTTHIEFTARGQEFYQQHFAAEAGNVYLVAPWGTLISRTAPGAPATPAEGIVQMPRRLGQPGSVSP